MQKNDLLKVADACVCAAEELEYFIIFAVRQMEFDGDADAGRHAVKGLRAAIDLIRENLASMCDE